MHVCWPSHPFPLKGVTNQWTDRVPTIAGMGDLRRKSYGFACSKGRHGLLFAAWSPSFSLQGRRRGRCLSSVLVRRVKGLIQNQEGCLNRRGPDRLERRTLEKTSGTVGWPAEES